MIINLGSEHFPKNLIYLRKKYALSRKSLAKLIGIPENRLCAIEKGLCYPEVDIAVLNRLCQIFQLTADDLSHINLEHTSDL